VQRAEDSCDIVSALSAEAGFIWAELAQCRYFSRVECASSRFCGCGVGR
jgi:hypothetical protein